MKQPLNWLPLLALAAMGLPMAMATLPFALHVPNLYTTHLGLSLAWVGAGLMLVRLSDVLIDPLVGALVDRRALRGSHRKAWIAVACLPVSIGAFQVLHPPAHAGLAYLLLWTLVFYAGWTLMSIPFQSWAAEISGDYHERTRIRSWIEAFTTLGTIAAAALPLALGGSTAHSLTYLAWGLAFAFPLAALLAFLCVPEHPLRGQSSARMSEWQAIKHAWKNHHFRPLAAAYTINGIGDALSAVVVLYYIDHVIKAPQSSGLFLGCLFGAALIAVPVWLKMSYRFGKHRAWMISLIWGCLFFAGLPFLGPGDDMWYLLLCIGGGIAFAADAVLPPAMLADVVDADTAKWKTQRTGLYFGLWAILTKLALALPAGFALPILQWSGFHAQTGGTPQGLMVVGLLYGLVPIVCRVIAFLIMRHYELDVGQLRKLQQKITTIE